VASSLALLLATAASRLPALVSHPFNIDESYYSAGAVELLSGGVFFRDVVDHKPPGIYWLYALIYRLAGAFNITAVHVALVVVVALTAYFVGRAAQEFFGTRAARWAAMLYVASSVVGPPNDFQAANSELFVNLPLVIAFWLAARGWVRGRISPTSAFGMGLALGLAVLIRPQAAWTALPVVVVFVRRGANLKALASAALGGAVPLLSCLGWMWHSEVLLEARSSFAYAAYYSNCLPLEVKLANGVLKTLLFVAIDVGLLLPIATLLMRWRQRDDVWKRGAGCLLGTWLLGNCLAVAMGGRFYPHYYIQLLPPLVVMAAAQLASSSWKVQTA
jgi:4-amino-4-deoxy-L-arabinose transferase-like glycosyltransferase